jgi:hypothetical protein
LPQSWSDDYNPDDKPGKHDGCGHAQQQGVRQEQQQLEGHAPGTDLRRLLSELHRPFLILAHRASAAPLFESWKLGPRGLDDGDPAMNSGNNMAALPALLPGPVHPV